MDSLNSLLNINYHKIVTEKGWKNKSRIIGEAIEDSIISLRCPICSKASLKKYSTNEKSKDIYCEECNSQFQVKGTQTKYTSNSSIKLLGAEYKTTCCSVNSKVVHFIIVFYSEINSIYSIKNIVFINSECITENCVLPRKPLSNTARRAGWQGCYLVFYTEQITTFQVY